MTISRSEDLLVGLIGLVLMPLIARRLVRGLRDGRLPLYSSYIGREEGARFKVLIAIHALSFLLVAVISADLLFGLGLREAL